MQPRRFLAAILIAVTAAWLVPVPAQAAGPSLMLDGLPLAFPVPPTLVNGRTMVPFRAIAEALGIEVTWDGETRSITAVGQGRNVRLAILVPQALVDGKAVPLDVPPMITESRTLVPLRFFSEVFGAAVLWNGQTQTVSITSPARPMRTLAFYAIKSFEQRGLVAKFSDAAYGWSTLTPDGRIDFAGDPDYKWPAPAGEITGERLLDQALLFQTRRFLMVHGLDRKNEYTRLVADPALSLRAAREVAGAVIAKGFDGVVLDIEYLGQTEEGAALDQVRQGYARFVEHVSRELRAAGKQTIVSVHPLNSAFRGYDYAALGRSADLLQVMAHDYVDRRTENGTEPAETVEEAIQLALAQVGREKLLLGIVSVYETPETLVQKVGLAKRHSLAGISLWRLGAVSDAHLAALEQSVTAEK